jgi:hypothetical protein
MIAATTRRRYLSGAIAYACAIRPCGLAEPAAGLARTPRVAPSADQLAWQDMEAGRFVRIAPNAIQEREYGDVPTPWRC